MKVILRRFIELAMLTAVIITLAGCDKDDPSTSTGNGSQQTGGDTGGGETSPDTSGGGTSGNVSQFAGTYQGTITLTAKALGQDITETYPVTVVIAGDGSFNVTTSSGWSGSGQLNGNSFSYSEQGQITESGITCSGTVGVNGSINGATLTGSTFTNNFSCDPVDISFSGSLNATKT